MNRVATTGVRCVVSALAKTWRVRILGKQNFTDLRKTETPFIYALWHSQILPLLWYHRGTGVALVVSEHHDAGLLADAACSWGFRVIRGSSWRQAGVTELRLSYRDYGVDPRVDLGFRIARNVD